MRTEAKPSVEQARSATGEELGVLLHADDPDVLLALVENPQFDESHAIVLLQRAELPANIIEQIARHKTLGATYNVRRDIVLHPHVPRLVGLRLVRHLYLFDLVRLTLLPSVPAEIRRVAEELILARLGQLPPGQKLALARRASGRVAAALLGEGLQQVVTAALDNPFLNEGHLLKLLARDALPPAVVDAVANHRKWSHLPGVRLALVRHPKTSLARVLAFLPDLPLNDLRDLVALGKLRANLKEYIRKEIAGRLERQTSKS